MREGISIDFWCVSLKGDQAILLGECSFFTPGGERGSKMVCERPKASLFQTDRERGFVSCSLGENAELKIRNQEWE